MTPGSTLAGVAEAPCSIAVRRSTAAQSVGPPWPRATLPGPLRRRGTASGHGEREVEGRTQGGRCEVRELVRRNRDDHAAELRRHCGDPGTRLSSGEGLPVW